MDERRYLVVIDLIDHANPAYGRNNNALGRGNNSTKRIPLANATSTSLEVQQVLITQPSATLSGLSYPRTVSWTTHEQRIFIQHFDAPVRSRVHAPHGSYIRFSR